MHMHGFLRCSFALLGCCLVFTLAACGSTSGTPAASVSPTQTIVPGNKPATTPGITPVVTTAPVPATQTSCPAAGAVRTAVTAPLALGKAPNIVYLVTEYAGSTPTSTLKRFNVTTGAKTEIVKLAGVTIDSPQLSTDGQWLLFVSSTGQRNEIQMVRLDGQGLQTLYCLSNGSIQNALWSTNQQQVLFSASAAPQGFTGLYLLNITSASIKQVLKPSGGNNASVSVTPLTWLNNTQAYVSFANFPIAPSDRVGLLDTTRGTQTISDLVTVYQQSLGTPFNYPCWDADSSYDASTLYVSQCSGISAPQCSGSCSLGTREGPGTIYREPALGGPKQAILTSQSLGIAAVRAVTSNTLLLRVENFSQNHTVDSSQNGLWKMQTNGSGLTRLTTETKGITTSLCQFSQNPWSNVSRDGSMYAFETSTQGYPATYTLAFGQLSGGASQTFASISGTALQIIGWTTL